VEREFHARVRVNLIIVLEPCAVKQRRRPNAVAYRAYSLQRRPNHCWTAIRLHRYLDVAKPAFDAGNHQHHNRHEQWRHVYLWLVSEHEQLSRPFDIAYAFLDPNPAPPRRNDCAGGVLLERQLAAPGGKRCRREPLGINASDRGSARCPDVPIAPARPGGSSMIEIVIGATTVSVQLDTGPEARNCAKRTSSSLTITDRNISAWITSR
jgi:hypothetical protein